MIPFEVNPGELPAIGAEIGAQESTLAALLQSVAPFALPEPTVFCAPGLYMSAGFGLVQAALFSYLDTGIVEKLHGGATLVPASVTFQTNDTAGSVGVGAVGSAISSSMLGG